MLKRTGSLKRKPIKKMGPKAKAWKEFRDAKFERDKDEDGLIECQCYKITIRPCGRYTPSPDLHHIIGRDDAPHLYFEESNLLWLTRECHEKVT